MQIFEALNIENTLLNPDFTGNEAPKESYPAFSCLVNMGAIYSAEEKAIAINFIRDTFGKMSDRAMAKKLNLGSTTVNRWRKELGLKVLKHTVNENYFGPWTSEMAYVLGLIATDGNVAWNPKKSYQSLTITAGEKDKLHLEKVRELLKSTKPLLHSDSTNSNRLIVNNKKICLDLMNFGIFPAKSKTILFPSVPDAFLSHFVRGIIDGDGNVRYVNRKKSPYFEITICSGSKNFLKGLIEKVSQIGITANIREAHKGVFVAQYSCKRGLQLAKWVYNNANSLYLGRKFEQFQIAIASKKEE